MPLFSTCCLAWIRERVNGQRVGRMLVRFQSPPWVIVNLSLVEWISSTFVNELVRLLEAVKAAQGQVDLVWSTAARAGGLSCYRIGTSIRLCRRRECGVG